MIVPAHVQFHVFIAVDFFQIVDGTQERCSWEDDVPGNIELFYRGVGGC